MKDAKVGMKDDGVELKKGDGSKAMQMQVIYIICIR